MVRGEVEDRVRTERRDRELGRVVRQHVVRGRGGLAEGVHIRQRPAAAHPHAHALDHAAGVVEEVQAPTRGVAGDARENDLGAVEPERAIVVTEGATDLQGERVGIGGLLLRELLRARPHDEAARGPGRLRRHGVEDVPPRKQVQDLGRLLRAVVHQRQVGYRRQVGRGQAREERERSADVGQVGRLDGDRCVDAVGEGLGRGESRPPGRRLDPVAVGGTAQKAPAVGVDPRPLRRSGHVGVPGETERLQNRPAARLTARRLEPGRPPGRHGRGRRAEARDPAARSAGAVSTGCGQ